MLLKTCLLVSDDPDDHVQFSEAMYEITSDIVVLVVMDPKKALELLSLKRHLPDYLILDLAINGLSAAAFLNTLESDPRLVHIPVIAYGEFSQMAQVSNGRISAFLDDEFTYSGLKRALLKIVSR